MPDLDRVESLFHEALALPGDADRSAFLEAVCANDPRLFEEVSALLEARTRIAEAKPAVSRVPSALFGAFRAVHLLGRGGMSAVYLAERADGRFHQTAALKVMAGYLADPEFVRRFDAEREFLAALNHHNITRLLDGGVSSSGDPFLVTEYVDGETIDRYCENRRLDVEARLRIFLQVCDAVDYAHRNLIVHRDLKPANIMVNKEGEVKLLDFGTASLTASAQANPTVTHFRMMTPRYASPEQLRGERVNISTDIFSLGVVLYELLTGAWPFGDPDSLLREFDRSARHIPANAPSAVVTEEAAKARSSSREQLRRRLKGDLSAVVLKALEGDPARRYETVRALANDLESFLEGRPVMAQPQTMAYRAGTFIRRRWLTVSAATVFVCGLSGATVVAVHQKRMAQEEAFKAEKVNEFLNGMLAAPAERGFDPNTFTVAQMLAAAEARLEKSRTGDARTEATLRQNLGVSYMSLMQFDRAKLQLEKALAMFRALGDEKDVASTLNSLAVVAMSQGRPEDAVQGYEEALEHLNRLGKDAPAPIMFTAKDSLGDTLSLLTSQRKKDAQRLLEEAVELGQRDLSIPRVELARAMGHLAGIFSDDPARSEAMLRQALAVGRREDPDGVWQADPLYQLGVLLSRDHAAEAVDIARQRYELLAKNVGDNDAETAFAKISWARGRARRGDIEAAVPMVLEAMKIIRQGYPPASLNRWVALSSSAHVLNLAKRYREAEAMAREMLPILDTNQLPETDPRRAESLLELGTALHGEKKNQEAAETLNKSAAIYDAAGPNWGSSARQARTQLRQIH